MGKKLVRFDPNSMSDINQNKVFLIGAYTVLGIVSAVMTIMNILTDRGFLTVCTAFFTILCGLNIVLSLLSKRAQSIAKMLFSIEVLCMFTFFLISGNPEGFSAIWICMLPALGMFFFDRYKGTILCAVMFVILVFLLWIPAGQSLLMYPYTESFKMRFPVLFLAFHFLAFFLEMLRDGAYKEMRRMQNYYHDLSLRDALTGVYNRQGMYSTLEEDPEYKSASVLGAAIIDIDSFKRVNDTYGHDVGDEVLKTVASTINAYVPAVVCRWGGEEFVTVFADNSVTEEDLDQLRLKIGSHEYQNSRGVFRVTVSIGMCVSDNPNLSKIDHLISNADVALYYAKSGGRDQLVQYKNSMHMENV